SNPYLASGKMDCFASLAMTAPYTSALYRIDLDLDRGDVDPAPLAPALQRAFGELHALGAFQQRVFIGRVLADVTDEHFPLLLEPVVVDDVVRNLLPVGVEIMGALF